MCEGLFMCVRELAYVLAHAHMHARTLTHAHAHTLPRSLALSLRALTVLCALIRHNLSLPPPPPVLSLSLALSLARSLSRSLPPFLLPSLPPALPPSLSLSCSLAHPTSLPSPPPPQYNLGLPAPNIGDYIKVGDSYFQAAGDEEESCSRKFLRQQGFSFSHEHSSLVDCDWHNFRVRQIRSHAIMLVHVTVGE